jgi:hypothetical protein
MALNRFFSYSQFRGVFLGAFGPVAVTADLPSAPANGNSTVAVTVPGLQIGDVLIGVIPTTEVAGVSYSGNVTAANTFSLVLQNGTGGAVDPASQVYTLLFLRVKLA